MKNLGIKSFSALFILSALCCIGCSKKQTVSEDKIESELDGTVPHTKANADGVICVLFGYGFNDEAFYTETSQALAAKYNLEEDGGLIWPLIYPDDFKNNGSGRISELYDKVKEKKIKGILLLGAPENTNAAIAHLQDSAGGKLSYPVFSFFPQDDILGMEATCDFVLEYERSAKDDANAEETTLQLDKNIEQIIMNAVKYMNDHKGPLVNDTKLHEHVQQIVGKNKKVRRFTDSESGLQSINHFVIERDEKKPDATTVDATDAAASSDATTSTATDKATSKKSTTAKNNSSSKKKGTSK